MGNLREKIFSSAVNDSLDHLRGEMCAKHKPKKESRFLTGGITYDISAGKLMDDGVQFEMSSKIPQELMSKKGMNERYFREVRDLMNKGSKKPADVRMENIIHSTNIHELKERDYVKCVFFYRSNELYTEEDIGKIVKAVSTGKMELPDIPGITTLPGRAVIFKLKESVYQGALKNISDMIKANEAVGKKFHQIAKELGNNGSAVKNPAKKASASAPKAKKAAPKAAKKATPKKKGKK
ncbi:MAG: hypothetical protein HZA04_07605 [Nitrospinae bacterium]|nr:hypothetical protein [Nitrospinota bacterium]